MAIVEGTILDIGGAVHNVKHSTYGAKGDVKSALATITSGSTTLTATTGVFASGDVGKAIMVTGAGSGSPVTPLYTKIAGFTSATVVTLQNAASTTVSTAKEIRFGTDDTDAFVNAAAAIQTAGGGTLMIPPGNYWVLSTVFDASATPPATPLCAFSALRGVHILAHGATVYADRPYGAEQSTELFSFTDCVQVSVEGFTGRGFEYVGGGFSGEDVKRGAKLVGLYGACRSVHVDADLRGYWSGVQAITAFADRVNDAERSKGISLRLRLVNCGYGANFQFSGDDVTGSVVTEGCWRTYFPYGVRNHTLDLTVKDTHGEAVLLAGYYDSVLADVDLRIRSPGSTEAQGSSLTTLVAHASVPLSGPAVGSCLFRDIRLHYDVQYGASNALGAVLRFLKFKEVEQAGGGSISSADTTARLHVIENLTVGGTITGQASKSPFEWYDGSPGDYGDWSQETYRNWSFENLLLRDTRWTQMDLRALKNVATFVNVASDADIRLESNATSRVVMLGCKATALCKATSDQSLVDYVGCEITSASLQSTVNKSFVNTLVAGDRWFTSSNGEGTSLISATITKSGSMSSYFNAFRVRHLAVGAAYRLTYYAMKDESVTNPVTREEAIGIKSWSAVMQSSGLSYGFEQAVADEVTERRLNIAAAIPLQVNLVAGDTTGCTVQLKIDGWTSASARGTFTLEVLGSTVTDVRPY